VIDIDTDITEIAANTLGNTYTLGWVGGLPPTEKDSVSESTYFYSYVYQGDELVDVKVGKDETFSMTIRDKRVGWQQEVNTLLLPCLTTRGVNLLAQQYRLLSQKTNFTAFMHPLNQTGLLIHLFI
jgi:hypothetical protein